MTLAQLRDAIRVRLGVATNDSFYGTATLNDLANEALQAISTEMDWPWLTDSTTFATVGGTATYALPATSVSTLQLIIDGYAPMNLRSIQEIRTWPVVDRGVPSEYTIHDEQIVLRLVPDGIYTVIHDFVRFEPALTQDSDEPLMPEQYHFAIVHMAAALAFERSGDVRRHESALQGYSRWLIRMRDNARRSKQLMRLRVRPGRDY